MITCWGTSLRRPLLTSFPMIAPTIRQRIFSGTSMLSWPALLHSISGPRFHFAGIGIISASSPSSCSAAMKSNQLPQQRGDTTESQPLKQANQDSNFESIKLWRLVMLTPARSVSEVHDLLTHFTAIETETAGDIPPVLATHSAQSSLF